MKRFLPIVLAIMSLASTANANDPVNVYAAGSLHDAFVAIAAAYQGAGGDRIEFTFGPAGLLRERIEHGAPADLFASANMDHPQALAAAGRGGAVTRFTRNALCAITLPGAGFTTENLIVRMMDPAVKLGIFTPRIDPSGDYALAVFRRVDAVQPGAAKMLEAKARPLLGGRAASKTPPGQNPIVAHLTAGDADLFLGYCTIGAGAGKHQIETIALPPSIAVAADYGLIVLRSENHPSGAAARFTSFVLSSQGQEILMQFGFAPK